MSRPSVIVAHAMLAESAPDITDVETYGHFTKDLEDKIKTSSVLNCRIIELVGE